MDDSFTPSTVRLQQSDSETDEAGRFTFVGLGPARYALRVSGPWQVLEGGDITLPTSGEWKVVLKQVGLMNLHGRVVSPAGDPIAGVALEVNVTVPTHKGGGTGRYHTVETDAEGKYSIAGIRPESEIWVAKATKPGYRYLSGGTVTGLPC